MGKYLVVNIILFSPYYSFTTISDVQPKITAYVKMQENVNIIQEKYIAQKLVLLSKTF